jgi:hypothetical protein
VLATSTFLRALGLGVVLGLSISTARGNLLIDTLDNHPGTGVPSQSSEAGSVASAPTAGTVLGTERDLRLIRNGGSGMIFAQAFNGTFTFMWGNIGADTDATFELIYDGSDGDFSNVDFVGLRNGAAQGVNLTADGATGILLSGLHLNVAAASARNLRLTVWTDATHSSTKLLFPSNNTTQDQTFLFSDLSGSADLTNIGAIRLSFMGTVGGSLQLDGISTVPEPATFALLLLSLPTLAQRRRRAPGR